MLALSLISKEHFMFYKAYRKCMHGLCDPLGIVLLKLGFHLAVTSANER